jgi:mycoredoxin
MSDKVILYGSPTCAMVAPVRGVLERAAVEFEYVDIMRDEAARQQVLAINGGNASVPTLVFTDGSSLTEPSLSQLKRKLGKLGYADGRSPTLLEVIRENLLMVLMGVALLMFGVVDGGNWVFLLLGGGLLLWTVVNGMVKS